MYYKWRDNFLGNKYKTFDKTKPDKKINRLKQKNIKLKQSVGNLSLELKKKRGALRLKRGNYLKVIEKNKPIVDIISKIKSNHPFWGYRRIWAHLYFINKIKISKNRVYRLMKINSLLEKPNLKLKAKRTKIKSKPIPSKPNEGGGIDMTKVMIDRFGWVSLVVVIDWSTKKIVGHSSGLQAKADHWL